MAIVDVPEISKNYKTKQFGASDIRWVKNVNDEKTSSAYLRPDKRVIINPNGVFFCLQVNTPSFKKSLNSVHFGELILLYQYLNNQTVKCFTHLVTPIADEVIQNPYSDDGGPGRWVKVIGMTNNQAKNSIPITDTEWRTIGFKFGVHRDLSYQQGIAFEINPDKQLSEQQFTNLQNNIWSKFQRPAFNVNITDIPVK
ncbi:hypothetical protein TREPR_1816 [Treponema primitia ZAS-2]|uniref:Uncharacterized protein n=1 Tax=Treponema primitia (strain ATCC BAA-887 / DSM 12427 / ZAS-2) TaxID=545694 RepID=F5YLX8_TREPZ|nr:hypothetical protein [Treponema primitia]AEF86513.1 hypothetical protein TREPR_1816 [Treponema primitia ZAS-2]